jgi:hypothetical protein
MLKPGKLLLELRSSGPAPLFNDRSRELVELQVQRISLAKHSVRFRINGSGINLPGSAILCRALSG